MPQAIVQILANDDPGSAVGRPSVLRGGLGAAIVHGTLALAFLAWQLQPLVLPEQYTRISLVAPAPPPPPPPPAPVVKTARASAVRVARFYSPVLTAPAAVPQHAALIFEEAPPQLELGGVEGGIPGGLPGGILAGAIGAPPAIKPPALPPAPAVAKTPEPPPAPDRIEVDAEIQAGKVLTMFQPVYPPMARQARIQGDVCLKAVIDRDGKIAEMRVLSGNPLLVAAAREAVQRWRYLPTLLHGQPVEVVTNITVQFRLNRSAS